MHCQVALGPSNMGICDFNGLGCTCKMLNDQRALREFGFAFYGLGGVWFTSWGKKPFIN